MGYSALILKKMRLVKKEAETHAERLNYRLLKSPLISLQRTKNQLFKKKVW